MSQNLEYALQGVLAWGLSTVLSSSEAVWKQAGRAAAVEGGGSWPVEMENDNNRSPSLFSTYSVLSTVTHFSIFSLKMTDALL